MKKGTNIIQGPFAFPVDPSRDFNRAGRPSAVVYRPINNDSSSGKAPMQQGPFDRLNKRCLREHSNSTARLISSESPSSSSSTSTSTSEVSLESTLYNRKREWPELDRPLSSFHRNKKRKGRLTCALVWLLLLCIVVIASLLFVILFRDGFPRSQRHRCSAGTRPSDSTAAANNKRSSPYKILLQQDVEKQRRDSEALMQLIDGDRIQNNLKWIASSMHVAGTKEQLSLMDRLSEEYRSFGLEVKTYDYDVLLSYPDYTTPNTIDALLNDQWIRLSNGRATRVGPPLEMDARAEVWWNAYSKTGTVIGQIVYLNYGMEDDYEKLKQMNVSVNGRIALIRYGGLVRSEKVRLAQQHGAIGVILYSDPFDFVPDLDITKIFPNGQWLPPSAGQRGTLLRTIGDPQTPHLPSKPYAHRLLEEELIDVIPNIPVTSIGYGDALEILQRLDGIESPWQGGLDVTYKLNGSIDFRLSVKATTSQRRIRSFVATMRGDEQEDRWVLVGNHADAWTNGAIDPGSGTATMLESARALTTFAAAQQTGWRPRRTIMFCQWDAEEHGLIGSTEWVQEMLMLLEARAVAYINLDNINGNTSVRVKAVPLLHRAIAAAAAKVDSPTESEVMAGRATLLDSWRHYSAKGAMLGDRSIPEIGVPTHGSDFVPFISLAGVPVADLKMESAPLYSYMLYHSMYEVPWVVERFVDPTHRVLAAMGKMWLELVRNLADSLIIPFNVEDYGTMLAEFVDKTNARLLQLGIDRAMGSRRYSQMFVFLRESIVAFQQEASHLQQLIHSANSGEIMLSVSEVEMINSRLLSLERCFLRKTNSMNNAPNEVQHRHIVFSHSSDDNIIFASIVDAALKWANHNDTSSSLLMLNELQQELSILQYAIESATLLLGVDVDME